MVTTATETAGHWSVTPVLVYEQTDVPEGLTLDEWRSARARERRAAEASRRRGRMRLSLRRR